MGNRKTYYPKERKAEVVKLATEVGVREAAKQTGIPEQTIYGWVPHGVNAWKVRVRELEKSLREANDRLARLQDPDEQAREKARLHSTLERNAELERENRFLLQEVNDLRKIMSQEDRME